MSDSTSSDKGPFTVMVATGEAERDCDGGSTIVSGEVAASRSETSAVWTLCSAYLNSGLGHRSS